MNNIYSPSVQETTWNFHQLLNQDTVISRHFQVYTYNLQPENLIYKEWKSYKAKIEGLNRAELCSGCKKKQAFAR